VGLDAGVGVRLGVGSGKGVGIEVNSEAVIAGGSGGLSQEAAKVITEIIINNRNLRCFFMNII
jgi:hypothetical protein